MAIQAPLTLVLLLLIFSATLKWRRQGILLRALILCWWIYHGVNIVFIPGIARYNAVIWPLTVLLAGAGLKSFWSFHRPLLLIIPCLALWLSHPPNDFQDEYVRMRSQIKAISDGQAVEIVTPPKTRHHADYRFHAARASLLRKDYARAEALLKKTPDWNFHGLDYTRLLATVQSRQHLYIDALDTAMRCYNWPLEDALRFENLVIHHIDEMLDAYHRTSRWSSGHQEKLLEILQRRLKNRPGDPVALRALEVVRKR
jgi:tetratricopeptide (TPR) repeat protein